MKCPTCQVDIVDHQASDCLDAWLAQLIGAKYGDARVRPYSTSTPDVWVAWSHAQKDFKRASRDIGQQFESVLTSRKANKQYQSICGTPALATCKTLVKALGESV